MKILVLGFVYTLLVAGANPALAGTADIAGLRDGDEIHIDIPNRTIAVALTAEEIADRLATTARVEKPGYPGYIQRYRKHVSSAAKGAILT